MTDLLSDPSGAPEADEYADLDPAVAKRLRDKDAFIATLENETATYRNELRARTSLEEITDRIARQVQQDPTPGQTPPAAEPPAKSEPVNIAEQVLKILEEERAKDNRTANVEKSRAGLRERFGADYNLYLKKAATTLGVSEKFLADMASTAPDGLLRMIDSLSLKEGDVGAPPPSSVDTSKQFGQVVRRNKAYYDNIRKADRQKYFSAAIQSEMHNEAMKQGPKFYEP